MKTLLILSIILLFGYLGFGMAKYYILRKKFFFSFNAYLVYFKSNINFNTKKITEFLSNTDVVTNKDLKQLLINYEKSLMSEKEISKENLFYSIDILNEQEKESIIEFFISLGKVDIYNQMEQIDHLLSFIGEYYDIAKEESKKNVGLYTKLGVLVGLFLALIFI